MPGPAPIRCTRSAVNAVFRNHLTAWMTLAVIVALGAPAGALGPSDALPTGERRPVVRAGVQIVSSGPQPGGTQWCVTVIPTGGDKGVGVTVEVNGVPVPTTQTRAADGSINVCFHVSAGAAGGSIRITATAGGSHTTETIPILPAGPTPEGG